MTEEIKVYGYMLAVVLAVVVIPTFTYAFIENKWYNNIYTATKKVLNYFKIKLQVK